MLSCTKYISLARLEASKAMLLFIPPCIVPENNTELSPLRLITSNFAVSVSGIVKLKLVVRYNGFGLVLSKATGVLPKIEVLLSLAERSPFLFYYNKTNFNRKK